MAERYIQELAHWGRRDSREDPCMMMLEGARLHMASLTKVALGSDYCCWSRSARPCGKRAKRLVFDHIPDPGFDGRMSVQAES